MRRCKRCNTKLDGKQRDDAVFCSDKCRMRHYRALKKRQGMVPVEPGQKGLTLGKDGLNGVPLTQEKKTGAPPLKGILNMDKGESPPPAYVTVQVPNPEHKNLSGQMEQINRQIKQNEQRRQAILQDLEKGMPDHEAARKITMAGFAAYLGYNIPAGEVKKPKDRENIQAIKVLMSVMAGSLGYFIGCLMQDDEKSKERKRLEWRNKLIIEHNELVARNDELKLDRISLQAKLILTSPILTEKRLGEVSQILALKKAEDKKPVIRPELNGIESVETSWTKALHGDLPPILEPDKDIPASGKRDKNTPRFINSMDLNKIRFSRFNFQGHWQEFLGLPDIHFELVIFGSPGSGKSTLAAKLANYLASSFGRVVYISAEEGISATFQDKMNLTGSMHPNLDVADIRHWKDLEQLPMERYNFLVLDSLQQLGIDEVVYKQLREQYPDIAIISISQSTKDGKMRGSNVIAHDVDISIEVQQGVAICIKNRFQATGRKFQVLPQAEQKNKKGPNEPDNIIF